MTVSQVELSDAAARRSAVAVHDRSFLVEAGAGTGKTAVMAGRIAMLLAGGAEPKSVAAVTFTEFAASELQIRVRTFVRQLAKKEIPRELSAALPDGISDEQARHLEAANAKLADMTCSTIHGFCRRLIAPYPVEADIDPGAEVMDRDQAELAFTELVDAWLREALDDDANGLIAELVRKSPEQTIDLIRTVLNHLRDRRDFAPFERKNLDEVAAVFVREVERFIAFIRAADATEPETEVIADRFRDLAAKVQAGLRVKNPARLAVLLPIAPHEDLLKQDGGFRAYRKKGKWDTAAKSAGLSKADGDRLNDVASGHYARCCGCWTAFREALPAHVFADLLTALEPVMDRFRQYKRALALLDFDDLIFAARNLLRDYDEVRQALAFRFQYILVDEFQDTDPLQTEIFWRLCGNPPAGKDLGDWTTFELRPGALFLVGDPKQAIYRFRGADIAAYLRARSAFRTQAAECVLSIATNFRSRAPIVDYVNERFKAVLSEERGQPGFQTLYPTLPAQPAEPSVAVLDVSAADENDTGDKRKKPQQLRVAEAEAVADLCVRLIGGERIFDHRIGGRRPCMAGDIALLAPTGRELWHYEEALEKRGIPVATQAGKGLYRRQEIQDLIALTRVLSDQRDRLALGALLRGPLAGLTEEELLDIVWALPHDDCAPGRLPRLDLRTAPELIANPHARDIIEKLQALRKQVNAATPHALLAQAVDMLRVRPLLLCRHRGQAERALANVDLYLSFSRAYAVRGLRAFAEAMTAAWSDETRAVEGRPDAQEDTVALYTIHAAKGLEWPVVVPINTMTGVVSRESAFTDRESGRFYCPVFGLAPSGYEAAREKERAELDRERERLWYVVLTRARELLILPRHDDLADSAWGSLIELALPELPHFDINRLQREAVMDRPEQENGQTRGTFAAEAKAIAESHRRIVWRIPSRDEDDVQSSAGKASGAAILATDGEGAPSEETQAALIQGGRERGAVLHKLIEEALTGETEAAPQALTARAETLILSMGLPVSGDPAKGLAPAESAGCVLRALSLPEIAALRSRLVPEYPVYGSRESDAGEEVTAGVVDALAFGTDGMPETVIDWKSDVNPSLWTVERYRDQVRTYMKMTGAKRGLVVLLTAGTVVEVN